MFQHTAARRRLAASSWGGFFLEQRFNTQPPEGGWIIGNGGAPLIKLFQHTAARRRLDKNKQLGMTELGFQHTAARRRLEPLLKALLHQVSQP